VLSFVLCFSAILICLSGITPLLQHLESTPGQHQNSRCHLQSIGPAFNIPASLSIKNLLSIRRRFHSRTASQDEPTVQTQNNTGQTRYLHGPVCFASLASCHLYRTASFELINCRQPTLTPKTLVKGIQHLLSFFSFPSSLTYFAQVNSHDLSTPWRGRSVRH
jgi:hypothetical protein